MDKGAIKSFAVWARRKLIEDITQKAFEIGIAEDKIADAVKLAPDAIQVNGRLLQRQEVKQRVSLLARIKERGFQGVIEETAYTWFNRIIAIRFMEINGYLPTGVRVLSSAEKGKVEPDIISSAHYVDLGQDKELVDKFLDEHRTDELFRYLFVKQCNKLGEILPYLFETIEDYTELLLPNNLLLEGSVVRRLVSDIPEENFRDQVEIIGWLYQYYISEKKDEVFAALKRNVKITKENIPAATQLFTPDWIVKHMIENSLGRLWLEGHPDEGLKANWKYYLDEAEQEAEVQKQLDAIREQSKKIRPEDIKLLDPCMGSGHILVYAFDVLFEIYESVGYSEKDIPKLILENNLYGLEIDDRAAQLAYFAVMMKARSRSRRVFRDNITLNLCAIQESNGITKEALNFFTHDMGTKFKADVDYLIEVFYDAKEYGSILDVKPVAFYAIEKRISDIEEAGVENLEAMLYYGEIKDILLPLVKQARIMSQKYDVVCTNPPYMGNRNMNNNISDFVKNHYPNSKSDMSTVFMEKALLFCKHLGNTAMINIPVWMFISSFEILRENLIDNSTIINMLHFGRGVFGSDFGTTAFVISNSIVKNYKATYRKLYKLQGAVDSVEQKEQWFFQKYGHYEINQENYKIIPEAPIAYWVSDRVRDTFRSSVLLWDIAKPRAGLSTGDNDKFEKQWFEVNINKIGFNYHDVSETRNGQHRWFPCNSGGEFRKWYGNNMIIVNWEINGNEIKNFIDEYGKLKSRPQNTKYYFKEGITWTKLSLSKFATRLKNSGFIFDDTGRSAFIDDETGINIYFLLGFLSSKVCEEYLKILNPTMSFTNGDIARLPILKDQIITCTTIEYVVEKNIIISKAEWDSFETSWDFQKHPLLVFKGVSKVIEDAFSNWSDFTEKQFNQLKQNEEELNSIFIDIYGLQDELTPKIEDRDITIRKADRVRDIKSFISYAVGCMLGRYSIDADGLIYAGGEWVDRWMPKSTGGKVCKIEKDEDGNMVSEAWVDATFLPAKDNILPILDDEYFDDDIVSRFIEFLQVTFGSDTLEDNLDCIAETLGKKQSETSRQTIRRYFLKDFYKDHVQIYQKRPIYWLFDAGPEDGFKALIYMHRYDEFTVARVRTDYLHKLQKMYDAEIKRLDILIDSDVSPREKTAARKRREKIQRQSRECLSYDQVIAHVANQRIIIDLDDGVKVNYAKFQGVEIPQGEGRRPLKANLLANI